jgi:hypothetical protein
MSECHQLLTFFLSLNAGFLEAKFHLKYYISIFYIRICCTAPNFNWMMSGFGTKYDIGRQRTAYTKHAQTYI